MCLYSLGTIISGLQRVLLLIWLDLDSRVVLQVGCCVIQSGHGLNLGIRYSHRRQHLVRLVIWKLIDISRSRDKIHIGLKRLDHNGRRRRVWVDLCERFSPAFDVEEDSRDDKDKDSDPSDDPSNDCALHEGVRFRALVGFLIVKLFCLLAILFCRVS